MRGITYLALMELAEADLLPVAECEKDGWVPLDCPPVPPDGVAMRCPCCFHVFAQRDVTFMDDKTRVRHGLLVVHDSLEQPLTTGWAPTLLRG